MCQAALLTAQRTQGCAWDNSRVFVHTHARSFRMGSGVGELTRPHKGTLFNLLHIKAQAPQSEQALTAVGTSQSLPLWRDSAQRCPQPRTGSQRKRANLASHCYDNPKSTQKPTQPFERAQKGFSPPLKASHCSFGALKCWYCFPRDFGHAFNMKPPKVVIKKVTIASTFNQHWSLNSFIKPITITAVSDEPLYQDFMYLRLN